MKKKFDYPHVIPAVLPAFEMSDAERSLAVSKDRWIPYTAATAILEEMTDLLNMPKRLRPPNLLIVAPAENGKTALATHFAKLHPRHSNPTLDLDEVPVVMIDAPGEGVESRIYSQILNGLAVQFPKSDRAQDRFHEVVESFAKLKVKMLIIDEIQGIFKGRKDRAEICLHTLKLLGNATKIPIVCFGIESAENRMSDDAEISSRFTPIHLPKWKMDDEYMRLLKSYECILPLKKPSDLTEMELAKTILTKGKLLLGGIDKVLEKAARLAISDGSEQITLEIVKRVKVLN